MEEPFIKWIVGQVGLAGVAAMAFWMLRQSYEERMAEKSRYREDVQRELAARLDEVREHREDMRQVVMETRACIERNTDALSRTLNEIRRLTEAIRCDGARGDGQRTGQS